MIGAYSIGNGARALSSEQHAKIKVMSCFNASEQIHQLKPTTNMSSLREEDEQNRYVAES
jgi:hypothetical protein